MTIETGPPKPAFGLRDLFIAVALVAVPIALFSEYYRLANNTVDERTIPLTSLSFARQAYFYSALATFFGGCALIFVRLLMNGHLRLARVFIAGAGVVVLAATPLVVTKVIDPVRGNPTAKLHNDAAALAALSVLRYFERTERWPAKWDDLEEDVVAVVHELQQTTAKVGSGSTLGGDPFADDQGTQSLSARNVDVSGMSAERLSKLVDIDFTADPVLLGRQEWSEFKGIQPHKPSYNMYRVEFRQLIDQLAQWQRQQSGLLKPSDVTNEATSEAK